MTADRRRAVAFAGVAVLLVSVLALAGWSFVKPGVDRSEIQLARIEAFEPGSVTAYRLREGRLIELKQLSSFFGTSAHGAASSVSGAELVYVVRLPDGDFRVLSGASTHRGQVIVWKPALEPEVGQVRGVFFGWGSCPMWTVDGTRIFGPAPRDMDRYRWEIDSDILVIDISKVLKGDSSAGREVPRATLPPYDVLDPAWPTSGWPSALQR